jgi:hypothetical protein
VHTGLWNILKEVTLPQGRDDCKGNVIKISGAKIGEFLLA